MNLDFLKTMKSICSVGVRERKNNFDELNYIRYTFYYKYVTFYYLNKSCHMYKCINTTKLSTTKEHSQKKM